MPKNPRVVLLLIIILTLAAVYINIPKVKIFGIEIAHPQLNLQNFQRDLEPKLGLDLAGGVQLEMSADMANIEEKDHQSAIESAKNIIESRINSLGVAEKKKKKEKKKQKKNFI